MHACVNSSLPHLPILTHLWTREAVFPGPLHCLSHVWGWGPQKAHMAARTLCPKPARTFGAGMWSPRSFWSSAHSQGRISSRLRWAVPGAIRRSQGSISELHSHSESMPCVVRNQKEAGDLLSHEEHQWARPVQKCLHPLIHHTIPHKVQIQKCPSKWHPQ